MSCSQYRESLSALLDGEPSALPEADIEAHLDRCAACRSWYESAARVTRLVRMAPAEPVADRTAELLAAVGPVRARRPGLLAGLRLALGLLAFVQAVLSWPGALLGEDPLAGAGHVAREIGAWNLALAMVFLAAASRPRTAGALVAPVGVFVAVLSVGAVSDAAAGTVHAGRLGAHLLIAAGLGLLVAIGRLATDGAPVDGDRAYQPAEAGPDGLATAGSLVDRPPRPASAVGAGESGMADRPARPVAGIGGAVEPPPASPGGAGDTAADMPGGPGSAAAGAAIAGGEADRPSRTASMPAGLAA
ncbi:MAG TPA: zf-HC2 domain-containing protein [Mycobacteriales bacterium]|nr:zf-HC2 domain-containing protein [Mycobacteriales bacterium]